MQHNCKSPETCIELRRQALEFLNSAIRQLHKADARQAERKLRACRKSLEGAIRHARRLHGAELLEEEDIV